MKKLRTLLILQAVIMLFVGLYIVGIEFSDNSKVAGTGNQIAAPPLPQIPGGDGPIEKTFTLFAVFGILLVIGAIIEMVILFFSAFR
ncbi:hypothetical protein A3K73_01430 [Candidatus Pacearchaeota archaeon RBG_13_36_9]|nr:MAG: hypothetical protein A3K73_01430 [Candidatus Pacearchaeota archaeon RBG_13_36_9]